MSHGGAAEQTRAQLLPSSARSAPGAQVDDSEGWTLRTKQRGEEKSKRLKQEKQMVAQTTKREAQRTGLSVKHRQDCQRP